MKWKLIGLSCAVIISIVIAAPTPPENDESDDDPSRLPKTSFPHHYDITLWMEKDFVMSGARKFDGLVKIDLEISENTNEIVLHSRGIKVEESASKLVRDEDDVEVEIEEWKMGEYDLLTIKTKDLLTVGEKFRLEIQYSTNLQLGTAGFYRSSYRVGNEKR
jgi:hypothetical protein